MDEKLFYRIIQQSCEDMKALHITISAGEPMLHPKFCNFLKICNKYNFSVNILSNLTMLTNDIIEEFKANPLLGVQTSLYSMDDKIHDGITQVQRSLKQTKQGILALLKNKIPIQISCPIVKQNKDSHSSVIQWAEEHGIEVTSDYVIIGAYNNTTHNLNCRLSTTDVKDLIQEQYKTNDNYLKKLKKEAIEKEEMTPDDAICTVCHSSICIGEDGNIYPCAGWQGYTLGNIRNDRLEQVWKHSDKVNHLRRLKRYHFHKCVQCVDKEYCTMCMVRNANEHSLGDPFAINEYFCAIARLKKEIVNAWEKG